ncbi:MAG TPA: CoA-transferase [Solirubrobacteraceae bacterium]|nr:CoA-transferase [Solirubrobacteraceae bacterium]
MTKVLSIEDAAATVPDGSRIAFGGGGGLMRRPLDFARALIRRGATDLHVFNFLGGIEIDMLVGAGAVASTNCAYIGLLEYGQAPNFQRLVREQALDVNEYSEFMFSLGLRAAELGLPFVPSRAPWGSEIIEQLLLKTVTDPYTGVEFVAIPAMELDIAVIHVERVDEDGYVERPDEPDLIWDYDYTIARVARTTIVTAEEIAPPRHPDRVAVIGREVDIVVEAPRGSWPAGMHPRYAPDVEHVYDVYVPAAQAGGSAFDDYLRAHVLEGVDS